MSGKTLPADRLPKGTTREIALLVARVEHLNAAKAYFSPHQIKALRRVLGFLGQNYVEGAKS